MHSEVVNSKLSSVLYAAPSPRMLSQTWTSCSWRSVSSPRRGISWSDSSRRARKVLPNQTGAHQSLLNIGTSTGTELNWNFGNIECVNIFAKLKKTFLNLLFLLLFIDIRREKLIFYIFLIALLDNFITGMLNTRFLHMATPDSIDKIYPDWQYISSSQ